MATPVHTAKRAFVDSQGRERRERRIAAVPEARIGQAGVTDPRK
jgi:hypothetical protein